MNSGYLATTHEPLVIIMKSINISFTQKTVLPIQSGMRQRQLAIFLLHWVVAVRGPQAVVPTCLEQTEHSLTTKHYYIPYLIPFEFTSH